jgi:RNA polymerase subunit RPABC4/transcription elongation factor Spt4
MSPRKAAASGETATCPWCSATVPVEATTCPSCGASLRDAVDGDILGVTQVDPAAVAKAKRVRSPRDIAAFLGVGDGPPEEEPMGKVEPISDEVRQEMLRLKLAALDAEIEAKSKEAAAQQALPPDDDEKAKPA